MTRIYDTFLAGGLVMWPLLWLSIATFATALQRSWFWFKLISQEKQIANEVLMAAKFDLDKAEALASSAEGLAIGRFLAAPLKLKKPSAETFHLAIKAASDKEFAQMRQGDKLLESVMAIAPLLGILGTSGGLITTFGHLKSSDPSAVVIGIGQAVISSATAITVAIIAFVFFRIFLSLQFQQKDFFSQVGNDLELIYLQNWHQEVKIASIQAISQKSNIDT